MTFLNAIVAETYEKPTFAGESLLKYRAEILEQEANFPEKVNLENPAATEETSMEPKVFPSQSKRLRRCSCPSLLTGKLAILEMNQEKAVKPKAKSAKAKTTCTLLSVENLQYPMPKPSERLSISTENLLKCHAPPNTQPNGVLTPGTPTHFLRQEQTMTKISLDSNPASMTRPNGILKPEATPNGIRLERQVTKFSVDSDVTSVSSLKLGSQNGESKNEAEIIDRPRGRRRSLPCLFGLEKLSIGFPGSSSAVGKTWGSSQGQGRRKGSITDSVDRELRSLYKNGVEERRLVHALNDLDRQSFAGILEYRHKRNELYKDYRQLHNRSPDAEEWLRLHKPRTNRLKEREREDIDRRYSSRARHFRAPPELQDTVDKIRSFAMEQAGFSQTEESDDSVSDDGNDEEMVKMASARMALRRHTISGDRLAASLSRASKQSQSTAACTPRFHGRRMTLADIRTFQEVLEFRMDHWSREYIGDQCKMKENHDNDDEDQEDMSQEGDAKDALNLSDNGNESEIREFETKCVNKGHKDRRFAVSKHLVEGEATNGWNDTSFHAELMYGESEYDGRDQVTGGVHVEAGQRSEEE